MRLFSSPRLVERHFVLEAPPRSQYNTSCGQPSTSYSSRTHQVVCRAAPGKGSVSERIGISRPGSDEPASPEGDTAAANLREEARKDRVRVCDKIIAVFRAKPSSDWRKLIAFSKQWSSLHESLFARLEQRVLHEADPKEKSDLRKVNRKLKEVHEELQGFNALLRRFEGTPDEEWEPLVAAGRGSLNTGFFEHMENLIRAHHDDKARRDELARIATRLLMLVDSVDKVAANEDALKSAALEFQNILENVSSLEDADKRIDDLAKSGKLDPALLLTMAKAYSAAKDTDFTREEVKDVMAHLYFKAKESFAAQQPAVVRILKHLLWLESPAERREAMEQAFTPGPQLASPVEDYLTTTPEELDQLVGTILEAYGSKKGSLSQMQAEASALMNPEVIERMQRLQQELRKYFM